LDLQTTISKNISTLQGIVAANISQLQTTTAQNISALRVALAANISALQTTITADVAKLQNNITSLSSSMTNIATQTVEGILPTYFQTNRLYIGSRWSILQETDSDLLTFRDDWGGEFQRYVMFPGV